MQARKNDRNIRCKYAGLLCYSLEKPEHQPEIYQTLRKNIQSLKSVDIANLFYTHYKEIITN